jgi:hypothetical protein
VGGILQTNSPGGIIIAREETMPYNYGQSMQYSYGHPQYGVIPNPHGPDCQCDSCRPPKNRETELLSTIDRIRELERRLTIVTAEVEEIRKGNNHMGYALWCQKGGHSFDENDADAERMTVDKRDRETGKKTGEEMTVHVCGRHAQALFAPEKKSLAAITAEINEAEEIDD